MGSTLILDPERFERLRDRDTDRLPEWAGHYYAAHKADQFESYDQYLTYVDAETSAGTECAAEDTAHATERTADAAERTARNAHATRESNELALLLLALSIGWVMFDDIPVTIDWG